MIDDIDSEHKESSDDPIEESLIELMNIFNLVLLSIKHPYGQKVGERKKLAVHF